MTESNDRESHEGRWLRPLVRAHPLACLIGITLAALLPFIHKAIHIDDTLFVETARQILAGNGHPLDANINWYGFPMRLADVNKNPPTIAYLFAMVARLAGWSEAALHATMLAPTLAAVAGIFALVRRMCRRPVLATLLAVFSPAFFVSATTLMPDLPMLTLWVWAVWFWVRAIEEDRPWGFVWAGVCVAGAALLKYPAIALLPLLAICGMTRRRWIIQCVALMIPVIALGIFEWVTSRLYGHGLIYAAFTYSSQIRADRARHVITQLIAGPCFMGGCYLAAAIIVPLGWRWAGQKRALLAIAGLAAVLFLWPEIIPLESYAEPSRMIIVAHVWLFGSAAILLMGATFSDLLASRDRHSLLLAAWIIGILLFATIANWSASARAILPMAPAIGILAARAVDRAQMQFNPWWVRAPVVFAIALCLLLAFADMQFANAARTGAAQLLKETHAAPHPVNFDGHWGFQWYMEQGGATPIDIDSTTLHAGELMASPQSGPDLHPLPSGIGETLDIIEVPVMPFVATINIACGGSFYSSVGGPLPYVFGPKEPERFKLERVKRDVSYSTTAPAE